MEKVNRIRYKMDTGRLNYWERVLRKEEEVVDYVDVVDEISVKFADDVEAVIYLDNGANPYVFSELYVGGRMVSVLDAEDDTPLGEYHYHYEGSHYILEIVI